MASRRTLLGRQPLGRVRDERPQGGMAPRHGGQGQPARHHAHARPHRRLEPPRDVRPRRRIARRLGHPRREHPPDHRRRRHPLGRLGRRTRRGRPHRLVYHGIRTRLHRRRDRLHARRRTSAPAAQVCLRLLVEPLLAILRRRAGAAGRADTEPLHTDRRSDSRHGVARHVGSVEHRHQARRVRPAHRLDGLHMETRAVPLARELHPLGARAQPESIAQPPPGIGHTALRGCLRRLRRGLRLAESGRAHTVPHMPAAVGRQLLQDRPAPVAEAGRRLLVARLAAVEAEQVYAVGKQYVLAQPHLFPRQRALVRRTAYDLSSLGRTGLAPIPDGILWRRLRHMGESVVPALLHLDRL